MVDAMKVRQVLIAECAKFPTHKDAAAYVKAAYKRGLITEADKKVALQSLRWAYSN